GDHLLACEPPTAVVTTVALAALLSCPAQMHPEPAAGRPVAPDPTVDRFAAHPLGSFQAQAPDNLFGAEVQSDKVLDLDKSLWPEARPAPGELFSSTGLLNRMGGPVAPVVRRGVALQLAVKGARVPTKTKGNFL